MKLNVKRHAVVQPPDKSIRLIPLTKGKVATVDVSDYEYLNQWNWIAICPRGTWYAARRESGRSITMHRAIVGDLFPEIDHHDHDGLNNRRTNLRPCSVAQNQWNSKLSSRNSSGFKGVSWNSGKNKWMAQAVVNKKSFYLGYFEDKNAAALAYNKFVAEKHGDFCFLNSC